MSIRQATSNARQFAISLQGLALGEGALAAAIASMQASCQLAIAELDIVGCQLSPECWPAASQLAHVTSLKLSTCERLGQPTGSLEDALGTGLLCMSGLKALTITHCCVPQPPAVLSSLTGLQLLNLDRINVQLMPSLAGLTGKAACAAFPCKSKHMWLAGWINRSAICSRLLLNSAEAPFLPLCRVRRAAA